MIYCLTIQHTGTWSALAWLNQHNDVSGFMTRDHVLDVLSNKLDGSSVFVQHPLESGVYTEKFHPSMVYHEHLRAEFKQPGMDRSQLMMVAIHPTLIPIRDPLAGLVSYQARCNHAETNALTHHYVDGWIRLASTAQILGMFGHVRFLCWDLLKADNFDGNFQVLSGIASHLGLKDQEPSHRCAANPLRNNAKGDYPLRLAYLTGDLERIGDSIADDGLKYLRAQEGLLRPFLEGLGYENLCWWSG